MLLKRSRKCKRRAQNVKTFGLLWCSPSGIISSHGMSVKLFSMFQLSVGESLLIPLNTFVFSISTCVPYRSAAALVFQACLKASGDTKDTTSVQE